MFIHTAATRPAPPQGSRPAPIPMDVWREGDRFVIALDLPGIPAEAIDIEAHGRLVTVRAWRRPVPRDSSVRIQRAERGHGIFERRIQLADTLDAARIEARSENGVLTLTVPVSAAAKRRTITVQSPAAAPRTEDPVAGPVAVPAAA
jgi:HSP20 family protein